jgi:hypothetical protein
MAIEQKSLDQRLGQILPGAEPTTPADQIQLEPMPAAVPDMAVEWHSSRWPC